MFLTLFILEMKKVLPYQYAPTFESVYTYDQKMEERKKKKLAKLRPSIFCSPVQNVFHSCFCEHCSIEKTKFSYCCSSFWVNEEQLTDVGRKVFLSIKENLSLHDHPRCCLTQTDIFKKKYLDKNVR